MNASIIGQSTPSPEPVEVVIPVPEPAPQLAGTPEPAVEIGGRDGPEPTRYGDWEKNGRCIDF
ncbi:DUF1674 domain-containing protein [Thermomonas sp.]|uniref:DUF1674 domain-containing protein n=1 Tax=Thermomonas sp. TaxID=1971895 RepID=UPI0035B1EF33